jgi:hypothetical protein
VEKPLDAFAKTGWKETVRGECKACRAKKERERWMDTATRPSRSPEYKRRERLKRLFGITLEEYEERLIAQDGVCAICRKPSSWNRREGELLVVDHCHDTGRVRGLLCHACNQALGLMRDNPRLLQAAADYIEVNQMSEE